MLTDISISNWIPTIREQNKNELSITVDCIEPGTKNVNYLAIQYIHTTHAVI